MATTYSAADGECLSLLSRVMAEHHPKLAEAGVKVDVLMAENPNGDAVKVGGCPAPLATSVVKAKERAKGGGDAEVVIDLFAWGQMTPRHKVGALDYALEQLELVPRKKPEENEPAWATDDRGRPKLRKKKGDWAVGTGYAACVERNGDFALEFLNIRQAWAMAQAARLRGEDEGEGEGDADAGFPLSELEEAA